MTAQSAQSMHSAHIGQGAGAQHAHPPLRGGVCALAVHTSEPPVRPSADPLGAIKAVARDIRSRFGDGVRLRAGAPAEWEQIEAGWRVAIPPKPFHMEPAT